LLFVILAPPPNLGLVSIEQEGEGKKEEKERAVMDDLGAIIVIAIFYTISFILDHLGVQWQFGGGEEGEKGRGGERLLSPHYHLILVCPLPSLRKCEA